MDNQSDGEGDYIYRGGDSTPQDGVPWDAPLPPRPAPDPTYPPPTETASKKKRWPWVVAALFVFCGLPIAGIVFLIDYGIDAISDRNDAIEEVVTGYLGAIAVGDLNSAAQLTDSTAPCTDSSQLAELLSAMDTDSTWQVSRISFVERDENSTFSSNADPERLHTDGRPEESAAVASGKISGQALNSDFEFHLSKPLESWRICSVTVR